jgi:predicted NBD/HSP70 family sugar kinase
VGGGVIAGGRPLRGTRGYVGEIGHLVVRPGGRPCYCGSRGCWETEVGEAALCRALGLPEDTPRGVVVAELRSLATVPFPGPRSGPLDEFAEWLATGLVTVVNVVAPDLVVLGDLFTALPPAVVAQVRAQVQERSLVSRAVGGTRIETSPLGRDAKLVGAAELAFEPVLGAV